MKTIFYSVSIVGVALLLAFPFVIFAKSYVIQYGYQSQYSYQYQTPASLSSLLNANPTQIDSGGSSTLTWTVANASTCSASGFSIGTGDSPYPKNAGSWTGYSHTPTWTLSAGQYFSGLRFRSNCDFASSEDGCISVKIDSAAASDPFYQPDTGGTWSAYSHTPTWTLSAGQYFRGIRFKHNCDSYSSEDGCISVLIASDGDPSEFVGGGSWTGYSHNPTWDLSPGQYISGIRFKHNCDSYSSEDGCISIRIAGSPTINGSAVVSPSVTTSYTLTCILTDATGRTDTETITVVRPDLTSSVPALNSGTLQTDQSVTFVATTTNSGSGNLSGSFNNRFQIDLDRDGSYNTNLDVSSVASSLAVGASIAATSPSWTAALGNHAVRMCSDMPPTPAPVANLTASPKTVTQGNSSTIYWSSVHADSCTGTGFSTSGATSGAVSVTPPATTNYSVSCTGPGGSDDDGVQVVVNPSSGALTASVAVSPDVIASGDTATLRWSSTNAVSCTGTGFSTGGATSGNVSVTPSATTNYSISCSSIPTSDTISVGSTSCGGGWCRWEVATQDKVCDLNGYDTVTNYVQGGGGGNVCGWHGFWSCDGSCTSSCSGNTLTQVSCTAPLVNAVDNTTLTVSAQSSSGSIQESNESNNCSSPFNFTVSAAPQCSDGIDNDGNGQTDYPADAGCSSDSDGVEAPVAECSDGIDNNGNGLVDYPADSTCTSALDLTEDPLPATISLTSDRSRVVNGQTVTLSWSATNVQASSCGITGTNGDSWTGLSGSSGNQVSSALVAETIYTLACTNLDSMDVSTTTTIQLVPSFEEVFRFIPSFVANVINAF